MMQTPRSAEILSDSSPAWIAWERAQAALAAGDGADALRWLERTHRLVPTDVLVALTLGSQRLICGDAAGAVALLESFASNVADAAAALTAAYLALGKREKAGQALTLALQRSVVTPEIAALAERVGAEWCGVDQAGRLRSGGGVPTCWLDGREVSSAAPLDRGDELVVRGANGAFLGSPLPIRRLRGLQGIVRKDDDGLAGWAWCPADAEAPIELTARGPDGVRTIAIGPAMDGVLGLPPLAQPRAFALSQAACDALGEPIAITDRTGRDLFGSPIWRGRVPDSGPMQAAQIDLGTRTTDIVVPVFGSADETLACLEAVFATVPAGTIVHVVDDASPQIALGAALREMAAAGRIRLHVHAENRGFPAAANTGIRAAAGRDVVLLNSDTIVPPGWLERLRAAAYHAADVGTATPLTQDGSIVSFDGQGAAGALDATAREANAGLVAAVPVGVGFCLYLRLDCLEQVGLLREDLFAQGYGEESEFCLRARRSGWRHAAALDVLVAHRGGASFGAGRAALQLRNQEILDRAYPEHAGMVAAFLNQDPLFVARRRMAGVWWAQGRIASAVVLVSHGAGGGVAEMVAERARAMRAAGVRAVVIVPDQRGCRIEGSADLRFSVPDELPLLAELLQADGVTHVEVHHLLGHAHEVLRLAGLLGVAVESWIHDAACFCPRIALIGRERRFCGEPGLAACVACVAAAGSNLEEPIGPVALVARSAVDLAESRRVVVPMADWARRMRRQFPGVRTEIVPWEDDRALPPLEPRRAGDVARICVVGAIGVEKGYDVLLACAADARGRGVPLEFVVCGYTEDDERLMAAGPVFVTGRYAADEAVNLIRAQAATLAFIPSIWPETWCFALTRAWQAGLAAVAFDLGAQAERIRQTGRGHVLPLGLPASGVNDALLRLASARMGLQPSDAKMAEGSSCQIKPALAR